MTRFPTLRRWPLGRLLAALLLMLLLPLASWAAAFTPGNIVVLRIGDGVAALSSSAQAVFLDEYTLTGVLVQTVALPTAAAGSNYRFALSGSSTSEGALGRSANGTYLALAGYDAATGTVTVASTGTNGRVVAVVDGTGTINTTTRFTDGYVTNNIRGAVPTDAGTAVYISGNGSTSTGGTRYATVGATTSTQISTSVTNSRVVNIINGQLYTTAASGAFQGVASVGTGLPTTTGQTTTALPGFPTAAGPSPYGFQGLDLNAGVPGIDVLYVADDRATTSGGIQKWSLVAGTWTLNGTIASATAALRGVSVAVSGGIVTLVASGQTGLYTVTDNAGYNAAPSTLALPAAFAAPATNTVFRGVAFAPVTSVPANTSLTITTGTFPSTAAGTSSTSTGFSLNNAGGTAQTVTLSASSGAPYSLTTTSYTVPAGGSVPVSVTFSPVTSGSFSGTLTAAVATFQNVVSGSFSGTATAPANTNLTITTGTFPTTATGSSSPSTGFTLNNASGSAQTVTLSASGAPFSLGTTSYTVPAGGSVPVTVTFAPTATGTFTGTLTAAVTGFQNLVSGSYSGTGVTPGPVITTTSANGSVLLAGIRSTILIQGTGFLTGAGVNTVTYSGGTINSVSNSTAIILRVDITATGAGNLQVSNVNGTSGTFALTTVAPAVADLYEPFELYAVNGAVNTSSYNTVAPASTDFALTSGTVTLSGTLLSNTDLSSIASERRSNSQAARMRAGGFVEFARPSGVGTLNLLAAFYGTDNVANPSATFMVTYSTNGGTSYSSPVAGAPAAGGLSITALMPYSFVINQPGTVRVRISNTIAYAGSNVARINIDDVRLSNYTVGDLTVTAAGQSIAGTYNNVTIASGGSATITGPLTVNTALTVASGGTLNTNCQPIAGAGTVTVASSATYGICDASGLAASATRSYSPDATYVYNGTVAQATGAGLPATVRGITVSNASGITLSQALSVSQLVSLTSGNLATGGNGFTLLSVAGVGTALIDNTGGTVTGTGTMQRAVDSNVNGTNGYHHFSSPVAATTLADLNIPGAFSNTYNTAYNTAPVATQVRPFPTVFGYDETRLATSPAANPAIGTDLTAFDKGWFSPAATDAMVVGRGYTAHSPNALVVDFVGAFNNGNQNITGLTHGVDANGDPDANAGYHLVGNPYPSPLNWDNVAAGRRAGLDGAMYVFNSTSTYAGTYRTRQNGVGGSPLIDAGSGFFVHANNGQTGAINLLNTDRVTTFGTQPAFGRAADARALLHLTLHNAANTKADDTYLYLEAGATAGFDAPFDAAKLANPSGLSLATLAGTQLLAINGLPVVAATATLVPLTVAVPAAGSYTFTAAGLANFANTAVVLRDALTGTRTVLTAGSSYRFATTGTTANGRFVLELSPAATALATAAQVLAAQVQVYPNPSTGRFHVALPAGGKTMSATLTNALGQVIFTRTLSGAGADFSVATPGLYTLRLTVDGTAVARKVVVE